MDSISRFFTSLAGRLRKENDLSDITWAMCTSNRTFLKIWVNYFWGSSIDVDSIANVEREVWDDKYGSSRADFIITMKNDSQRYVIENKIYDTKHHFGVYEDAFSIDSDHLGYITNYEFEKENYEVKQWKKFYYHLKLLTNIPSEDKSIIDGYAYYIKSVCNIMTPEKPVRIQNLTSLYDLSILLKEEINRHAEEYESEYFKDLKYENAPSFRRYYMKVTYKNVPDAWRVIYPYWGVWFNDDEPRIAFGFDKDSGWCQEVVNFLKMHTDAFNKIDLQFCSLPFADWGYRFYMSDSAKEAFNMAKDIETQQKILTSFLDEAIGFPIRVLESLK